MDFAAPETPDDDRPEWAARMLSVREWCRIMGEHPSTVYRKIHAGIYPPIVHVGSSARLPGWECWDRLKSLTESRTKTRAELSEAQAG